MSWWDRFTGWWRAIADTKVVGPGAPGPPVCALRVMSEADREWLRETADALDAAARTATGNTVTWTTAYVHLLAARLREMAG